MHQETHIFRSKHVHVERFVERDQMRCEIVRDITALASGAQTQLTFLIVN